MALRIGIQLVMPWVPSGDSGLVWFSLIQLTLFVPLALVAGLRWSDFRPNIERIPIPLWKALLLGLCLKWPAETLRIWVELWTPSPPAVQAAREVLFTVSGRWDALELLFCAGLLGPVVEEVLYRGPVFRRLQDARGVRVAAGLTGALFVFSHPVAGDWLPLAGVTLVLSSLRAYSGGLGPSVAAHVGFNLFTCVVATSGGAAWVTELRNRSPGLDVLIAVLSTLLAVGLLSGIRRTSTAVP